MLIQEISEQQNKAMEDQELKFKDQFRKQAENEKLIKSTMEELKLYSETLEKERMNERSMRMKLEEEYTQNTKNHEEEV